MGIVTQSIGTASRNFSTIQAWEDALPANLITDGNSYVGECYNDSEFTASGIVLNLGGETTDSTHTITLKCHAGQSFRDNANVQTNALVYNQSNGVGIRLTGNYSAPTLYKPGSQNVFFDGLQVSISGINSGGSGTNGNALTAFSNATVTNCLFQNSGTTGNTGPVVSLFGNNSSMTNCVIIQKFSNATAYGVTYPRDSLNMAMANCTIICPSDVTPAAPAIHTNNNYASVAPVVTNCAFFGFSSVVDTVGLITGTNNASDLASIGWGSANQTSKTFTSQFQGTLSASLDLRAKSGGDLINNGATDTTDIPSATDIAGTSRPQGSAWDIGCWELVIAAAASAISQLLALGVG